MYLESSNTHYKTSIIYMENYKFGHSRKHIFIPCILSSLISGHHRVRLWAIVYLGFEVVLLCTYMLICNDPWLHLCTATPQLSANQKAPETFGHRKHCHERSSTWLFSSLPGKYGQFMAVLSGGSRNVVIYYFSNGLFVMFSTKNYSWPSSTLFSLSYLS